MLALCGRYERLVGGEILGRHSGEHIAKLLDGFKWYCAGDVFLELRDFAVQAGTLNRTPVSISQAAYRHLQNTVFGGKLQLHDIGPAKGKVFMARRQPEMDRIVRLDRPTQEDLRRRIQIRVLDYITTQIGDPAWHIYTAFTCARHFPNLFKVQKLKNCIWQSFHFRHKPVFRIKPPQLSIRHDRFHHMAAVRACRQIPKALECEGLLFLEFHPHQPLKGGVLPLVKSGETLCQIVQLRQICCRASKAGAQHLKVVVIYDLQIQGITLWEPCLVQCVQQLPGAGRELQFSVGQFAIVCGCQIDAE